MTTLGRPATSARKRSWLGRHFPAADDLTDDAFAQDGPELERAVFGDAPLALVADGHAAVDVGGRVVGPEGLDDGAGVALGLEQAGHEHLLIGADGRGV